MTNLVYADFAASTPTDERVLQAMTPFFAETFGNPSSLHQFGLKAAEAVTESRQTIAGFIHAQPEEIYFTATGTESNNLAILGIARANKNKGRHIITTAIEHPSILNACRALEKDGWQVTYLPVNKDGLIDSAALKKALTKETLLVTTHYGNSEIGVLQNVIEIGQICRDNDVYFHVDACQAMAFEPIDVQAMKIDLLTFNGSKMYGPKGVAVLFVRQEISIFPLVYGGGQEQSLRSGTENVAGIVGLAKAAEIINGQRSSDSQQVKKLRDELEYASERIQGVTINANSNRRLPNHLSITLRGIKNTDLVKLMDQQGIAVASGSACSSKSIVDSHVLRGIGLSGEEAQATLRITLGRTTTEADCLAILEAVKNVRN